MDVRKLCRSCLSDNQDSSKSIYLKALVTFNIPTFSFAEKPKIASQMVDSVLLADMLDECCKPIVSFESAFCCCDILQSICGSHKHLFDPESCEQRRNAGTTLRAM